MLYVAIKLGQIDYSKIKSCACLGYGVPSELDPLWAPGSVSFQLLVRVSLISFQTVHFSYLGGSTKQRNKVAQVVLDWYV
jgi:hypothetical protein